MTEQERSGRFWMWGIVVVIALFLIWMTIFGIFSFTQDVNLVTERYYEHDMAYEDHLQRVALTEALSVRPEIDFKASTHTLELRFPGELVGDDLTGSIQVYRPADRQEDRIFELVMQEDTVQVLNLRGLQKGFWRVKLGWNSEGFGYYLEDSFVVP